MRCLWNLVYCKILIWRCAHYYHIPVHWVFLELCPKLCTCTSLDSNVQLCTFKHRNSPFELFFTKYGFDIELMDLHEILLLYPRSQSGGYTGIPSSVRPRNILSFTNISLSMWEELWCQIAWWIVSKFLSLLISLTGVNLNGLGYPTNVHIFIQYKWVFSRVLYFRFFRDRHRSAKKRIRRRCLWNLVYCENLIWSCAH
jgi:hypothetical protein